MAKFSPKAKKNPINKKRIRGRQRQFAGRIKVKRLRLVRYIMASFIFVLRICLPVRLQDFSQGSKSCRLPGAPPGLGASPLPPVGARLSPGFARHPFGIGGLRPAIASSMGGIAAINLTHQTLVSRLGFAIRLTPHHRLILARRSRGLAWEAPPLVE